MVLLFHGDLSGTAVPNDAGATFLGTGSSDSLGGALASGDLTGDGFLDPALGARGSSASGASWSGAVYVVPAAGY